MSLQEPLSTRESFIKNVLKKRVATSALHDTSTRQNGNTTECHPLTRRRLLAQLVDKPFDSKESSIIWFYGPAGAGKTAIMRSLATALEAEGRHLGSFHFWRSDSTRDSLQAFIATLAYQISRNIKLTAWYIDKALEEDDLLLDKSNSTQLQKLIILPLLAARKLDTTTGHAQVVLTDGLDACDEEDQREFLKTLLSTLLSQLSDLRLTFYISSRPDVSIHNKFNTQPPRDLSTKIFLEPSREDADAFLEPEFCKINESFPNLKDKYGGQWPSDVEYLALLDKSSGYFILLKTALRHINPPILRGRTPDQRLQDILEAFSTDSLRPLDALYLCILRQHVPQNLAYVDEWKTIIGPICIPLFREFAHWVECFGSDEVFLQVCGKRRWELGEFLAGLESLIYFDQSTSEPKNYHASFPDCIFNVDRGGDFYIGPGPLHAHRA